MHVLELAIGLEIDYRTKKATLLTLVPKTTT